MRTETFKQVTNLRSTERNLSVLCRISHGVVAFGLFASVSPCQQASLVDSTQPAVAQQSENDDPPRESKRILGIIPNYRTSPSLQNYEPLTTGEKFKLASEDAFDRGTVGLAALFGGEGQLTNANRSFGQGAAGFGRYFGASYGDFVIGDYMTEAIYPTLLHQDPRYFRRGTGTVLSRLAYSAGQIFLTHGDSGRTQFYFSEVAGNSTAVAISMAYYPENRDVADGVSKLGVQLGVDIASN